VVVIYSTRQETQLSLLTSSTSRRAAIIAERLSKIHILILDPSPQSANLLKDMLQELGFPTVFVCHTGREGLDIMKHNHINLIVIDWSLAMEPEGQSGATVSVNDGPRCQSGLDFVRAVRFLPLSRSVFTPIALLSESIDKAQALSARDSGVDEICLKPLTADKLSGTIAAIVDRRRVFVTANTYRGPDRRRTVGYRPGASGERRKLTIQVIKYSGR